MSTVGALLSRALTLTSALALLTLQACKPSQSATDPRSEARLVRVTTVHPASPSDRAFTGIVTARVQSDLGFRVAGKVVERMVDVGQTVQVGQPLMRLDHTDLAHAIAVQAGNVAAARARAIQAAAEEARYRALVPSGAASRSQYDQARAVSDSARALLAAAEAQARVTNDEGGYAVLSADADGTVVETLAEPGQVVMAGQTVLRLAHAGAREASVDLPETLRPDLGSEAMASLYGSAQPAGRATLRQLSDAADPRTRTFDARYVLDGSLARAPLGATVTLRIGLGGQADDKTVIPLASLDDEGSGPGVWVVNTASARVAFRHVRLQSLGDEQAIVQSGLRPGETIVAMGGRLLHEGAAVRVAGDEVTLR